MSNQMALMADEAFAQGKLPPGYQAIAGYLFSRTAYHPWTKADWAKFGTIRKLPIYVSSEATGGTGNGTNDAFAALAQLYQLGVPKGSPVALDMETRTDPGYVTRFHEAMTWAGYRVWVYGSASTVFANPACEGYWVADYAGKGPFMYSHPKVRATQYASGTAYDSSTVAWWQYTFRLKSW